MTQDITRTRAPAWVQTLLAPLNLAAYVTWVPIAFTSVSWPSLIAGDLRTWAGLTALGSMAVLFLLRVIGWPARWRTHAGQVGMMLVQGILVVAAEQLLSGHQVLVLMIVVAAQLVLALPTRRAVAYLAVFNATIIGFHWQQSETLYHTVLVLLPLVGFQAFAGLTAYYAHASELARERLAAVNDELFATQRLLEDSVRSGERLKLSRELHDIAGHKLTALKISLRCLARDPAWQQHRDIVLMQQLTDELLHDIRGVVSELRLHEGVDLGAALLALSRPLPGTRIEIEVGSDLRVDRIELAEAFLRIAQEGLTNALRHGQARLVTIRCQRQDNRLILRICDDGKGAPLPLIEGNGLRGMRERIAEWNGDLQVRSLHPQGLELLASVPTGAA